MVYKKNLYGLNGGESNFDPWGVRLNGTEVVNGFQNRWELQGKEKEMTFGLNRVNFGARVYNPTIGRFDRVDPLAEKFYPHSPFNFSLNNPVNFIDPDGREAISINGSWKYTGEDAVAAFQQLQMMGNGGGDDKDKNKNKHQTQSLPIGDIGTGLGVVGEGLWFLGENKSANLYKEGFRRGIDGNYQLTGHNFSLFGNQAMTEATKPVTELDKVAKFGKFASSLGTVLSVTSSLVDIAAYSKGTLSGTRLSYRAVGTGGSIAAAAYLGGPYGATLGLGFTGLEKAYDWTEPARKEIVNSYGQFKRTLTSSWLKFK
ncbi:hypothetical protein Lbys_2431 [Leadbetterella byssophila DSM 17132]|uniref:RHS repeat-associated core domain-containing protein n=1 Tax=Leadbetterella byssophila (strain DSM 17132 / JCM 16389 / KACC 11308 / NBRC 106382 / 4M15) TaxID=649349 RepID=E4RXN5_LEAB4|nr:RHS repeat-associated core domain-containing protein [Leadbetterella byssophila]ADQ18099.1 hypothetical protein Lbys_2431 [Leadbetterella byssophila DSM 17132]